MRAFVAITLALSVFAILVSPYAASELTTLRTPHRVHPPTATFAGIILVPLVTWLSIPAHGAWEGISRLVVPGSEVIAVTCARLC